VRDFWEREARGERELGMVRMSELVRETSGLNAVWPLAPHQPGSTGLTSLPDRSDWSNLSQPITDREFTYRFVMFIWNLTVVISFM